MQLGNFMINGNIRYIIWSCMDVRVGLWRKLSMEELMLLNCGIREVHPKGDQSWVFIGRTDAKGETPILWPPHAKSWLIGKDWCWEGLGAGGEGDDRGWDGWMTSPTRWMWVWVNSGSWWWTGRIWIACCNSWGHKESDTTEPLNWIDSCMVSFPFFYFAMENFV